MSTEEEVLDLIGQLAKRDSRELTPAPYKASFIAGLNYLRGDHNRALPLSVKYLTEQLSPILERFTIEARIQSLGEQLEKALALGYQNLPGTTDTTSIISPAQMVQSGLHHMQLPRLNQGNRISQSEVYAALTLALCNQAMELTPANNQTLRADRLINAAQEALGLAQARQPRKPAKKSDPSDNKSELVNEALAQFIKNRTEKTSKHTILEFIEMYEPLIRAGVKIDRNSSPDKYIEPLKKRIQRLIQK
ncbi:MAG: hypothetical protein KUG75_14910 [Pseudomonadales bacterium]|nr:hypothetical protein [Pseudomonadales bacterium]